MSIFLSDFETFLSDFENICDIFCNKKHRKLFYFMIFCKTHTGIKQLFIVRIQIRIQI